MYPMKVAGTRRVPLFYRVSGTQNVPLLCSVIGKPCVPLLEKINSGLQA